MQTWQPLFSRFKWFIICILIAGIAGCGFHLRGDYNFAFSKIYVNSSNDVGVTRMLKKLMRRLPSLKLVDNPKEAQVILYIDKEKRIKDKLTYNTQGRVREYTLRYIFDYSVKTPQGAILADTTEFALERTMTYDDSDILAKEHEKTLLYDDMIKDAANQLLRRLAALQSVQSKQTQLINPNIQRNRATFKPRTQKPLY